MRKACIAVLILTAVLLCGCKGTEEKKEEVLLGMECNYEGTTFTIDKVELRNSKFFRVYLSGLEDTGFADNIFLLKTKDNPKCGPSDNHCDTGSTGILTYTFEDGITLEEVLALRVRPLGTKARDESYTEFPLML